MQRGETPTRLPSEGHGCRRWSGVRVWETDIFDRKEIRVFTASLGAEGNYAADRRGTASVSPAMLDRTKMMANARMTQEAGISGKRKSAGAVERGGASDELVSLDVANDRPRMSQSGRGGAARGHKKGGRDEHDRHRE